MKLPTPARAKKAEEEAAAAKKVEEEAAAEEAAADNAAEDGGEAAAKLDAKRQRFELPLPAMESLATLEGGSGTASAMEALALLQAGGAKVTVTQPPVSKLAGR